MAARRVLLSVRAQLRCSAGAWICHISRRGCSQLCWVQAFGSLKLTEERVDAAIDLFERVEYTRGQVPAQPASFKMLSCSVALARGSAAAWHDSAAAARSQHALPSSSGFSHSGSLACLTWLHCAQVVLAAGSLVPKLYILRGGALQVTGPETIAEAGGFSYFGENVLEVHLIRPVLQLRCNTASTKLGCNL